MDLSLRRRLFPGSLAFPPLKSHQRPLRRSFQLFPIHRCPPTHRRRDRIDCHHASNHHQAGLTGMTRHRRLKLTTIVPVPLVAHPQGVRQDKREDL